MGIGDAIIVGIMALLVGIWMVNSIGLHHQVCVEGDSANVIGWMNDGRKARPSSKGSILSCHIYEHLV